MKCFHFILAKLLHAESVERKRAAAFEVCVGVLQVSLASVGACAGGGSSGGGGGGGGGGRGPERARPPPRMAG